MRKSTFAFIICLCIAAFALSCESKHNKSDNQIMTTSLVDTIAKDSIKCDTVMVDSLKPVQKDTLIVDTLKTK